MPIIDVEVDDVELDRGVDDLIEHHHMMGEGIDAVRIEAEAAADDRSQICACPRIARGVEGHLMALPDKLFGQVRDDALRTAVENGWNALEQRRDDRDSQ